MKLRAGTCNEAGQAHVMKLMVGTCNEANICVLQLLCKHDYKTGNVSTAMYCWQIHTTTSTKVSGVTMATKVTIATTVTMVTIDH